MCTPADRLRWLNRFLRGPHACIPDGSHAFSFHVFRLVINGLRSLKCFSRGCGQTLRCLGFQKRRDLGSITGSSGFRFWEITSVSYRPRVACCLHFPELMPASHGKSALVQGGSVLIPRRESKAFSTESVIKLIIGLSRTTKFTDTL